MKAAFLLLCLVALGAAEPPAPPDPLGLGERLALIDHLQEAYGIAVEPGLSLDALQARYAAAWAAIHPDEGAAERDQAQRLRRLIAQRYDQEPAADLDLAGLKALQAQLAVARAEQDAEIIRRRLAQPAPEREPSAAASSPAARAAAPPAAGSAAASPPGRPAYGNGGPQVTVLDFSPEGVAGAALIRDGAGGKTALCVQFGAERSREFRGVFSSLFSAMAAGSRGPKSAVFLLGHGTGVSINGAPIGPHLKKYREFYESLGGSRPAARLDCIVIASCSKGSPVQMSAMRDGFGYYPTWRVATAQNAYANAVSVIAAFRGIADRDAGTEFRGIYRYGREPEVVGSLGEVGVDGAKGGMLYYDLDVDGGVIRVTER